MPEGSTAQAGTAQDAGSTSNTAQGAGGSQAAAGSRTFTQEEVNSLIAKERRDTEAKFAGFDDFKAKAARLDEIEEANKSDLEKAQADAARYKEKADRLEAEAKRAADIAAAAEEYGVDAAMLARMSGDVTENAKFLKGRADSAQKYPSVSDNGSQGGGGVTKEDILKMKGRDRVRAMGAHPELFRKTKE